MACGTVVAQSTAPWTEEELAPIFDAISSQVNSEENQLVLQEITELEQRGLVNFPAWHVRFLHIKSKLFIGTAQLDTALTIARQSQKIARANDLVELTAHGQILLGDIFLTKARHAESLQYYQAAEDYFRAVNGQEALNTFLSKKAIVLAIQSQSAAAEATIQEMLLTVEQLSARNQFDLYSNIANVYAILNDHLNSIRLNHKAYDLAIANGWVKLQASISNNIAYSFAALRQFDQARRYYHQALAISNIAQSITIRNAVHLGLARAALAQEQLDSVVYYANLVAINPTYQEDDALQIDIEFVRAQRAFELEDYPTAYQHLLTAQALANTEQMDWAHLKINTGIAKCLAHQRDYRQALQMVSEVIDNNRLRFFELSEPLDLQYQLYQELGLFEQAVEVQTQRTIIKDSLLALERIGILASIEADFQLKTREENIERLELENALVQQTNRHHQHVIAALVIVVLLAVVLGYYFSRHRKFKLEQSLAEVKESLLRLQINPHFIFNTLNSIQSSFLQADEEKTILLFSRFSTLMRQVLQNSEHAFVSLSEELDLLINYLELEKIRSNDKFRYDITVAEGINLHHVQVPSMILQIFVENSIWHGIAPKEGPGFIQLRIVEEVGRYRITIEDDGVGRSYSLQNKSKGQQSKKSLGTQLAKQRIQQLNQKFGSALLLDVQDVADNFGTRVTILA